MVTLLVFVDEDETPAMLEHHRPARKEQDALASINVLARGYVHRGTRDQFDRA
jgi:hypothetical protein